jgi:YD repeat-containing protein
MRAFRSRVLVSCGGQPVLRAATHRFLKEQYVARKRSFVAGVALGALLVAGIPSVSYAAEVPPEQVFTPTDINRQSPNVEVEDTWAEAQLPNADQDGLEKNNEVLHRALEAESSIQSIPTDVLPENDYSIGAVPWAAMESFDLWEGGTAQVNLDSGNLLLSVTDWESNSPGLAPRMTRYYNSLSDRESNYLGNWTLGVGSDVGVAGTQSTYASSSNTFFAPSGYTANIYYDSEASGGWENAWNLPAGLNISADANEGSFVSEIEWNRMLFGGNEQGQEGWLVKEEDRNGLGTTYGYDSQGEQFTMTDAAGRTSTFSTASDGANFETPDGRTWSYSESDGLLLGAEGPSENYQNYEYNDQDRLTLAYLLPPSDEGPAVALAIEYDEQSRVAAIAQGSMDGSAFQELTRSTFTYEDTQTKVTDARGNTATYVLDEQGRQVEAIDANGNSRTQEWTANSDIASTTDALTGGDSGGNTATYTYDDLNNAIGYQLPTGAAASAAYAQGVDCPNAGTGNDYLAKCTTDTDGNTTEHEYDEAGNRTKESKEGGAVTKEYVYEKTDRSVCGAFAGQICSATDGNGNLTSYTYNSTGDLAKVTPPAPQGATTYVYDDASRVISVTDGNGDTTTFTHDAYDRVVEATYGDGSVSASFYGPQGALVDQRFTTGELTQNTHFEYDGLMREVSKSVSGPATAEYAQGYDGQLLRTGRRHHRILRRC